MHKLKSHSYEKNMFLLILHEYMIKRPNNQVCILASTDRWINALEGHNLMIALPVGLAWIQVRHTLQGSTLRLAP